MSEWPEVSVNDIKASTSYALATGPFGSSISSRFFQDHGVPVIRGSNLSEKVDVRFNPENLVFISEEKAKKFERSIARSGDLVFTCWGTIGQVGLIEDDGQYPEYVVSNKQMKLTPDPQKADSLFLYYLFSGPEMLEKIINQAIGSSVPGFNLGQLRALKFRLPPLPIQRRIAEILGRLDDKIEVNRRINRALEAMAQALFQHHFVDFGPYQGELVESEVGLIPRGWEVGTIEDVLELAYGKGLTEKERIPGPYPVFGSSGQVGTHNRYLIEAPGIIVGRKGTIGKLSWAQENFWPIDTTYFVVPKRQAYSLEFIFHLLDNLNLESRNNDSAVPGLNRNDTYRLPVVIPPDEVLQCFNRTVKPWFKQIDLNNQEIAKLAEIRDYLLPRLLSGEVEVF